MADNIDVTPGTGKVIAADEIGGVLYQRVKPTFGADGAATDVSGSNPLPVVQTGTPTLPSGAATEASLAKLTPADSIAHGATSISTVAQIVASNSSRKKLVITNPVDSPDTLYIGGSGVSTSDGTPLMQGASITIETTAAVHGVAASGTISVRYLELT